MKWLPIRTMMASVASVICLIHCAAVPFVWSMRPMLFQTVLTGGPNYAFMPVKPSGFDMLTALWAVGYKYNVAAAALMLLVFLLHRDSHHGSWPHRMVHWLAIPFIIAVLMEPLFLPLHWVAFLISIAIVTLQVTQWVSSNSHPKPQHS